MERKKKQRFENQTFQVSGSSNAKFTSRREKNLWLWTLVVLAAIFSTLGLSGTLSAQLAQFGLHVWLFVLCCFLVLVAMITHGLKTKPQTTDFVIGIGAVAVYLFIFVRMTSPVERSHLIEYGIVALLIYEALNERLINGRHVKAPALLAALLTFAFGVLDECIQLVIPNRVFDPLDIVFNLFAAALAVSISAALRMARRWTTRLKTQTKE